MIPVLGVPTLNQPDRLNEMLVSINRPIEGVVIVDNGGLVSIHGGWTPTAYGVQPVGVVSPVRNLGVAASWNLIMKMTPLAPYWVIVNDDIVFGEHDLQTLEESVNPDVAEIVHLLGFAAFAMTAPALDQLGYFDENFHPAYDEDIDMSYRARLVGVTRRGIPAGLTHVGSATIYANDGALRNANHRTHGGNDRYYARKWGGEKGDERFKSPFNRGGPVWEWSLEPGRLREQSW